KNRPGIPLEFCWNYRSGLDSGRNAEESGGIPGSGNPESSGIPGLECWSLVEFQIWTSGVQRNSGPRVPVSVDGLDSGRNPAEFQLAETP
ncbi:hypothetical protein OS493_022603, partial [Desmophyllum pertusum]